MSGHFHSIAHRLCTAAGSRSGYITLCALGNVTCRTYLREVSLPRPIRFDVDTWLCMRNDPVLPKAVIQRVHHRDGGDRYLVFRWDMDPAKRQLMNVCDSLEKANELVRFDPPAPDAAHSGPANGRPGR